MVVVFSTHSNGSPQVLREIERAVNKGIPIIPFRVEDVMPSKDLEYFISSCHWLDAMNPPLEERISELGRAIRALEHRDLPGKGTVIPNRVVRRSRIGWFVVAGILAAVLIAGAWFVRQRAHIGGIQLKNPADGASLVGPLLLTWATGSTNPENLSFEVELTPPGKPRTIKRTARDSIGAQGIEGTVKWRVRPIWEQPGGHKKTGPWSKEQTFTYYRGSLDRILATRRIHVGTAEPDGFFVRQEGHELTGYEIELLRNIGTRILQAHGIAERPALTYTRRIWGEDFFRLLDRDGAVDVLASAISITPEREKNYSLSFTKPTFQYPQTMVAKPGVRVFADGKIVINQIGAVEKTTNETLARKLLGDAAATRLTTYAGTGAYDRMLADLIAEKLDGVLVDKPYALQKIAELKQTISAELVGTDITPAISPGVEFEKIGFALRKGDSSLLQEINAQLSATEGSRDGVLSKAIPGWNE
jgi:ABC-type amino acid transport substrate-binding protein